MEVLIIRGGALGDTLMLLPALSAVSKGVEITFVGRAPGLWFMKGYVAVCMDLDRSGWHRLFQSADAGGALPVGHAHRVIAFFADQTGGVHRNLEAFLPHAVIYTFPSFPPRDAAVHTARYVAQCLCDAGLPLDADAALENSRRHPLIQTGPPEMGQQHTVFHPGSGDPKKNHPPQWWCRLMHEFSTPSAETGTGRILLLGPAEEHLLPLFKACLEGSNTLLVWCPSTEQLTRLLREARLFIGHDSGVTHLSAMLGTPTVALFKGTDPVQWGPLGPGVRVITRPSPDERLIRAVQEAALFLSECDAEANP